MKKTILVILLSLILLSLNMRVSAQEIKLPNPGITPDSIFYFLDIIVEKISILLTFGEVNKAERYADLAAERLAEAKAVAEKGKPEFVEKTLQEYEAQLNNSISEAEKAISKNKDVEKAIEVMTRVGETTSLHLEVLAEVYEKVPEEAKPGIENAMEVSVKGHEKAVRALKEKDALAEVPEEVPLPESIPQEIQQKIQIKVEVEKILENLESFESIRSFCIEQGGGEACEKIPLEGFESFEAFKDFCIEETGETAELCASLVDKCKEYDITTADECFLFLSSYSISVYQSATPEISPAPNLPTEEHEIIQPQAEEHIMEMPKEQLECGLNEIIFYYSDACSPCQKVKDEGTLEKIEALGVRVIQIDATAESAQYELSAIPAFVIGGKVYIGYMNFEQIKDLLNCQE